MDATTVLSVVARISVQLAHVIWFPINKLINLVVILLLPFYKVITFVLLPFIHLGQSIIRVLSIPFSVKCLERIEVFHYFIHHTLSMLIYKDTICLLRNSQSHRLHHRHHHLRRFQVPVINSQD
jgi:hypothetical protein